MLRIEIRNQHKVEEGNNTAWSKNSSGTDHFHTESFGNDSVFLAESVR